VDAVSNVSHQMAWHSVLTSNLVVSNVDTVVRKSVSEQLCQRRWNQQNMRMWNWYFWNGWAKKWFLHLPIVLVILHSRMC